jgi:hypothetical protein
MLFLILKEHHPLNSITRVQSLTITKSALMSQFSARCKKLVAGRLFISFAKQYTPYNTYHENWRSATTTYQILAPRYKSIADIEDSK